MGSQLGECPSRLPERYTNSLLTFFLPSEEGALMALNSREFWQFQSEKCYWIFLVHVKIQTKPTMFPETQLNKNLLEDGKWLCIVMVCSVLGMHCFWFKSFKRSQEMIWTSIYFSLTFHVGGYRAALIQLHSSPYIDWKSSFVYYGLSVLVAERKKKRPDRASDAS